MENSQLLARLGARIRSHRKASGFSQERLADHCDLDRTYVGGIERGERNISLRNLAKISEALDLSISELTKGIDDVD